MKTNKIHKENLIVIQVCVVLLMIMAVAKYGMVIETLLAVICLLIGGTGSTVCYKIVKSILTTDSNVVLMSATPNYEFIEFLRDFSGKDVETYNVKYDNEDMHKNYVALQWFERKKGYRMYDIVSAICDKWRKKKMEYEKYPSKVLLAHNKVAFFYNSVKEISNIVNQMPDTSDVEVLCAKTELHEGSVPCYSKEFNPEKQIHFMTSAYFTGMDIDKKHHFGKVVFIGGNSASYLAYSNKTVKQALGRFRGGYASTAFIFPPKDRPCYKVRRTFLP